MLKYFSSNDLKAYLEKQLMNATGKRDNSTDGCENNYWQGRLDIIEQLIEKLGLKCP